MKKFLSVPTALLLLAMTLSGCVWYGPGGYHHGWGNGGGGDYQHGPGPGPGPGGGGFHHPGY